MTKSIEEQAREYVESKICFNGLEYSVGGNTYNECFRAFLVGAKARDAQWIKVVNELREALKKIEKELGNLTYTQQIGPVIQLIRHNIPSGEKEYIPKAALQVGSSYSEASDALIKADQMLKEMGIESGK